MANIELVIKIPEEAKQAFDCAGSNDLKGCYYDHGGVIGNAIKNGTPIPDNATNGNELFDWVMANINAEKSFMGSCHDLADEEYHKGIIYAFECMKMKLM